MNKKAIKLIAVLAFLALMTCLAPWVGEMLYFNYYDVLEKPNIFEISDARLQFYSPSDNEYNVRRFFIVKKHPENFNDLDTMIMQYVESENLISQSTEFQRTLENKYRSYDFAFWFYLPESEVLYKAQNYPYTWSSQEFAENLLATVYYDISRNEIRVSYYEDNSIVGGEVFRTTRKASDI